MTPTPSRSLSVTSSSMTPDLVAQVEMDGGLVEDEHAWRLGERHGQHDQLPLPEGEPPRVSPDELADADPLDGRLDGGMVAVAQAAEGILVRDPAERNDFLDPRGEGQADLARHDGHATGQAFAAVLLERQAVEKDRASSVGGVAGQDPQQARLAGAVGTQDGHPLAAADTQVEAVEDRPATVVEAHAPEVEAVRCGRARRSERRHSDIGARICWERRGLGRLETRGDHRQTS